MAYFSNGTEHAIYEDEYCHKCHFYPEEETCGCPVMEIHWAYNYDQFDKTDRGKELASILGLFIPTEELYAGKCRFFLERERHEQEVLFDEPTT